MRNKQAGSGPAEFRSGQLDQSVTSSYNVEYQMNQISDLTRAMISEKN